RSGEQPGVGLAHDAPHRRARPQAPAPPGRHDHGAPEGVEAGAGARGAPGGRRSGRAARLLARRPADVAALAVQFDRDERAGTAGPALSPRRAAPRWLSARAALREPGRRDRDLQLLRPALHRPQRRLGSRPRCGPPRARPPGVVRRAPGRRRARAGDGEPRVRMTSALVARGIELAARTALTPLLLAARWTARDVPPDAADVPAPRRSVGLALKIALDEVFFATEVVTANIVSTADRTRIRDEMAAALTLYEEEGWLAEPAAYHRTPPAAALEEVGAARARGVRFRHLRFPSEYEPHPAEPGRARWLGHVANQTAHAWVLEHDGPPRPWLVCVPAYRMGHPLVDFTGFPAAWFHHRRGLNVVIPVLPLHGPRKSGWRSGDGFFSGDYVDTVHWQAQAVWDVRRLIAALRLRGAPAVGV